MTNVTLLPKPFTVVLMRRYRFEDIPGWECEPETDIYVALIYAHDKASAVRLAKEQVIDADNRDLTHTLGAKFVRALRLDKSDYTFLVLFDGHQEPKCWGWESGPWQNE